DHARVELGDHSLGQLTPATPDLEDKGRIALPNRVEHDPVRVRPGRRPLYGRPRGQAGLIRVLLRDEARVVQPTQGSTIGWPGSRRPGALPPSQALTVAPTSANSPSWRSPFALRPATYASSNACSREWSVEGVVGSQP